MAYERVHFILTLTLMVCKFDLEYLRCISFVFVEIKNYFKIYYDGDKLLNMDKTGFDRDLLKAPFVIFHQKF